MDVKSAYSFEYIFLLYILNFFSISSNHQLRLKYQSNAS